MAIPVRKNEAACGAEIVFDLSTPIDAAIFGEIERAFHDHVVVFFRDQHLSE
jgi:alpha-ketoglutarate-dependent taurine dioxygenase